MVINMSKLQKYILEQFEELDILGVIHSYVISARSNLKDKNIKAIKLSRNFGQHHAITAGLSYAHGEYIVVMDCDLQDQPEEIEKLYKKILEGYDIVLGCRKQREDSFLRRLSSKLFYTLYSYASGISMDKDITNFGIYTKKVINNFLKFKEQHRFFPIAIKWLGFNCVKIDTKHFDFVITYEMINQNQE